jgi:hypothetical protein
MQFLKPGPVTGQLRSLHRTKLAAALVVQPGARNSNGCAGARELNRRPAPAFYPAARQRANTHAVWRVDGYLIGPAGFAGPDFRSAAAG